MKLKQNVQPRVGTAVDKPEAEVRVRRPLSARVVVHDSISKVPKVKVPQESGDKISIKGKDSDHKEILSKATQEGDDNSTRREHKVDKGKASLYDSGSKTKIKQEPVVGHMSEDKNKQGYQAIKDIKAKMGKAEAKKEKRDVPKETHDKKSVKIILPNMRPFVPTPIEDLIIYKPCAFCQEDYEMQKISKELVKPLTQQEAVAVLRKKPHNTPYGLRTNTMSMELHTARMLQSAANKEKDATLSLYSLV